MNFSTFVNFVLNNIDLIIAAVLAVISFVVNIILAIKKFNKSKLFEALKSLPEVINSVEVLVEHSIWTYPPNKGQIKKELVQEKINDLYGRLYTKNQKVFDDAIEDILSTPQKKGGSVDVSQENKTIQR